MAVQSAMALLMGSSAATGMVSLVCHFMENEADPVRVASAALLSSEAGVEASLPQPAMSRMNSVHMI